MPAAFGRDDQRQLQPLEVTVDVVETCLAQPLELVREIGEAVAGVVLGPADLTAEALVKPL